jgi:site-specific recombinase XerD
MKIEEAYPLFLAHGRAERQYAAETLTKLKDSFTSWILPHLGDLPIAAVSRIDILSFRSKMVNAGLSINRQYGILMALKLFLKFCRMVLKIACLDPNTEIQSAATAQAARVLSDQ